MNKMKRIFSFVLVFALILGTFSPFVSKAFAADEPKAGEEQTKPGEETKPGETKPGEEAKPGEETKPGETKPEDPKPVDPVDPVVPKEDTTPLKVVPSDVIGTEYELAIRRLVAFGIVGGYPDGTYKPENDVNRAQFAKIIVEALGLSDAVPAANGQKTGFKDVQGDYWAAGYINVASGQGLLKGYPDGTFRPGTKVTYAQALTMLVRALGYQDDFLYGQWPGNYVAKAADVGITKGVKIPSNAKEPAKRGYIAQLVNNALDSKVVKVETYADGKISYYETDIPLLKDKLEISKYDDTRIIADKIVDDGLGKEEVRVRFLEDSVGYKEKRYDRGDVVKKAYAKGTEKEYKYVKEINPRAFIGEEITTYLNDSERVIYVERENDDKANFDYVTALDGKKLDLVAFDKKYDFDDDAVVYLFNSKDDKYDYNKGKDFKNEGALSKVGKVVVRNNKIVFAELMDSTEAPDWYLVRENKDGLLVGVNHETEKYEVNLKNKDSYDGALVYDTKGNILEVKDIKEGDLVYVQQQTYDKDDYAHVVVSRKEPVVGELKRARKDKATIDEKEYNVVRYKKTGEKDPTYVARYSVDGYEDVKVWDKAGDWELDMQDTVGEKVSAYLDPTGRVAFLTTDVTTGYRYGLVTRTYADNDRVKIYTTVDGKEGKDTVFKLDRESNLAAPKVLKADGNLATPNTDSKYGGKNLLGQAVKFKLNKKGEITKDELYVMPAEHAWEMQNGRDFGSSSMMMQKVFAPATKESFGIRNAATVIDAPGILAKDIKDQVRPNVASIESEFKDLNGKKVDIDNFNIATWENIKSNKYESGIQVFVFPKADNKATSGNTADVDGLVFVGQNGANTAQDSEAVYVLKKWVVGNDDIKVKYHSEKTGKIEERVVDGVSKLSEIATERPYIAKVLSNGKVKLVEEVDKDNLKALNKVYKVTKKQSGTNIQLDGKDYRASNGVLIYDEDKTKSLSYFNEGDEVRVAIEGDKIIKVISMDKKGSGSTGTTPGLKDGEYKVISKWKANGFNYTTLEDKNGKKIDAQYADKFEAEFDEGDEVEARMTDVKGENVITYIKRKAVGPGPGPGPVETELKAIAIKTLSLSYKLQVKLSAAEQAKIVKITENGTVLKVSDYDYTLNVTSDDGFNALDILGKDLNKSKAHVDAALDNGHVKIELNDGTIYKLVR